MKSLALSLGRDGWHGELIQRALDGRELQVETSVSILTDDDGTVLGSVSNVLEISGRKEAERQIYYQATRDRRTGIRMRPWRTCLSVPVAATSIEPVAPHPGIGSNRLILLEVIKRWLQVVP